MPSVESALKTVFIVALAIAGGGIGLATLLRTRGLTWTWAALGLPLALIVWPANAVLAFVIGAACLLACTHGARWHGEDVRHGGDLGHSAGLRVGVIAGLERLRRRLTDGKRPWVRGGWMVIGRDQRGIDTSIPVGYESGSHTLVVGATGSGKTVTQTWIVSRLIEAGHGAIVIDPKGDQLLARELEAAAHRRGAPFLCWSAEGPLAYNPYAHGTDTELADKALAGERFTEPHYLRQAQRYLGHAVRTMRTAEIAVTPVSLVGHLDPGQLEVSARGLPEVEAGVVERYLDSLSERQKRELAGVRDRLAILAESDARQWLDPGGDDAALDLDAALAARAVVYFRLDADRRMLLSQMVAAAIVGDLVTLVADRQADPIPTAVLIDEFSAIVPEQVARLFGRARSAGVSLILGTQELADLKAAGEGLRERVLGNLDALIAHRQNVPESAELIAQVAGSKPMWITTQQTEDGLLGHKLADKGTRRRGYEFEIHPNQIKCLPTGWAAVITPGSDRRPTIAKMHHPAETWR